MAAGVLFCHFGMLEILLFLPGMYVLGLYFGFLLSMLAAIIERPFIENAGVRRSPLAYSIRANSLAFLMMFGYLVFLYYIAEFLFWCLPILPGIVFISFMGLVLLIIVKGFYLRNKKPEDDFAEYWGPIILGNLASAGLIFLLGIVLVIIYHTVSAGSFWWRVGKRFSLDQTLFLDYAACTVGVIMFLGAFVFVRRDEPEAADEE